MSSLYLLNSHPKIYFSGYSLVNMTSLLSVYLIFPLFSSLMAEGISGDKITLKEEDIRSIIGAFYGGLCLGDDNCLGPLSSCDRSLGLVSTTTQVSCHQAVIQAVTAVTTTQGIFRLDGRCRPVTEVWIGLGVIGSVITLSCCLGCLLRWRLRT